MSIDRSSKPREIVRLPVVNPREKISYSEWQLFRSQCQWRWHLEYAEKHKMGDRSIALEFGTAMHAVFELYLHPVVDRRITVEQSVWLFHMKIDQAVESLMAAGFAQYGPWRETDGEVDPGDSPAYLKIAGARLIRAIAGVPEFRDSTVVRLEYEIDDVLERTDAPIRYRGFIDLLLTLKDGHGRLISIIGDLKTCKWGWPYQKKQDPDVLAQVRLYKHFFCKKLGIDPKLVRTHFFLMKKSPRKKDPDVIETLRVPSSERDIKNTLEAIQGDITRMRAGVYEKNRDNCVKPWGLCPHYDTERCPGRIE